jgi:hypothetical protein
VGPVYDAMAKRECSAGADTLLFLQKYQVLRKADAA